MYRKCKSQRRVEYGFDRGKQRYLCKECKCNYVENPYKGYSQKEKQEEQKLKKTFGCGQQ
jgi:transposase-like protein